MKLLILIGFLVSINAIADTTAPIVIAQKGIEISAIRSKITKYPKDSKLIMASNGVPWLFSKNGIQNFITGETIFKNESIKSIGFLPNGGLLTISNGRLGHIEGNKVIEKITLPHKGMKVTPKDDLRVLVYGGEAEWQRDVYLINADGTFKKLISAPERVIDLKSHGDRTLFATAKTVYEMRGSANPKPMLSLFTDNVQSIAIIPGREGFLLSTDVGIFWASKKKIIPLLSNVNCQVAVSKNDPFAFCPERNLFVKLDIKFDELPTDFTKTLKIKNKKGTKKWKK